MTPVRDFSDDYALIKFNQLMSDRERIEGMPKEYVFTHVFDIYVDGQSERWFYGPDGYCHIQSTIDSEQSAVYKVRNYTLLNRIIGVDQDAP